MYGKLRNSILILFLIFVTGGVWLYVTFSDYIGSKVSKTVVIEDFSQRITDSLVAKPDNPYSTYFVKVNGFVNDPIFMEGREVKEPGILFLIRTEPMRESWK